MNIINAKFTQNLTEMKSYDVIIIGGGAAGYFGAINIAAQDPELRIAILERGKEVLTKVKVSGGGRCNVTHAEFDPKELVKNYPRGQKELLGPFHTFMTGDTIAWFEERGVSLKIEEDGRMFPASDSSQTIIDCFLKEVDNYGIDVLTSSSVKTIEKHTSWVVKTNDTSFECEKLLIASGSNSKVWHMLESLGHTIISPVPSLFTFDITDARIKDIPGVVAKNVEIHVVGTNLYSEGPLLITHVGMSAPAILKLSAYGAIDLAKMNYQFQIKINFIRIEEEKCLEHLKEIKQDYSKKMVQNSVQYNLPKRLWKSLVKAAEIPEDGRWADMNREQLMNLKDQLTKAIFDVHGKSTFKEEFVTAGGVDLKEINFKSFESKLHKNLYFAGEVLNIDAVTGGFNFQNAWTGAYIAAQHIAN